MQSPLNISQAEADELLTKLNLAISNVCNENGLVFEKLKGNYSQESMKFNGLISWMVNGKTRHQNNFSLHAEELGLDETWVNYHILYRGENFEIIGLDLKKYSYPIFLYNLSQKKSLHISPDKLRQMWRDGKKTLKI